MDPVVKMKKLTKNFVDIHLDAKLKKESKKIFEKITANHLSYLPRLQNEEINKDFPEDLPNYLMWPGKALFPVEKKPAIRQELLAEVEAEEFTENTPRERRRRPRYAGTYNVESLTASQLKAAEEQQNQQPKRKKTNSYSSETSNVSKASTSKVVIKQSPPPRRKKTISQSSAGSCKEVCASISSVSPLKMKITKRRIQSISSSSSSCGSPEKVSPLKWETPNGKPVHATSSSSSSSSSGSSSDSSDEELTKKNKKKKKDKKEAGAPKPSVLKESKLMKHSRKQALNTPKVVNLNPNPKPFVKEAVNKPLQEEVSFPSCDFNSNNNFCSFYLST